MNKKWLIRLSIGIFLLLSTAFIYLSTMNVNVTVRNVGEKPIERVRVEVTGISYDFGTITPGQPRSIIPQPTEESTVNLWFADSAGKEHRLQADVYFEPNSFYRGHVLFSIDEAKGDSQLIEASVRLFL